MANVIGPVAVKPAREPASRRFILVPPVGCAGRGGGKRPPGPQPTRAPAAAYETVLGSSACLVPYSGGNCRAAPAGGRGRSPPPTRPAGRDTRWGTVPRWGT